MVAIVLIMLVSNTAITFLTMEIHVLQVPAIGLDLLPEKVTAYNIGHMWLNTLNVSTSFLSCCAVPDFSFSIVLVISSSFGEHGRFAPVIELSDWH